MKTQKLLKPIMIFFLSVFCAAEFHVSAIYMTADQKNQVDKLTNQINRLQQEIHEKELQAMKAGVNSEKYMRYEGDKYMDEIQKADKFDHMVQILQQQVEELKQKKNEMIHQGVK